MRTILAITTIALAALAGCSSDPNSDSRINGMDRNKAAVLCQKHLAGISPGTSIGDFSTVGADGLRKINADGVDHWQVNGELNGRTYQCRVTPIGEDDAEVEGAFTM
ncbi:hypothetical protein [Dietzia sp. ANT_WB102]|uniref:hypothetical protein n=1 Tax=Dietzia sp. ANT_WB102 TaxID=2597345 RepID=UPI0011EDDFC2|nr:hypothetical protein [Dietzia sp. ANT_WB102]KAA0916476.1 hypothetical protein FQ137_14745 [Dietzia sp. ANT_WB102]